MNKNAEPYLSTYFHHVGRLRGLPIAGNFELTARCNFSCPMCYVHMTEDQARSVGRELTAEQWLQIAQDARDQGMIFALLTGGEPLMRKDLFEIYRGMKKMGLLVTINSNGSLLHGNVLEQFLEDPPMRFNISLYGGCNETYETMCGVAAYDRVKENIRALREAGVEVSLNLSITPYNRDDLAQICADARELGIHVRATSYMYPAIRLNGKGCGTHGRLSPEEAALASLHWDELWLPKEEFVQRAKNMAHFVDANGKSCPVEAGEGISCRAGSTSFWVTWDGKMRPCGMMTFPSVDLLDGGFAPAWETLKAETKKLCSPTECRTCDHREICGVCAAVCVTETGRFDGVPRYMCEKTKAQVRIARDMTDKRCRE